MCPDLACRDTRAVPSSPCGEVTSAAAAMRSSSLISRCRCRSCSTMHASWGNWQGGPSIPGALPSTLGAWVPRFSGGPDLPAGDAAYRGGGTAMGAERARVAGFGRLEDGLRQAAGTLPGSQFPLGATVSDGGSDFPVPSAVADGMVLCLFDEAGAETQIPLRDYDAGVWHAFLAGAGAGEGLRGPVPVPPPARRPWPGDSPTVFPPATTVG